MIQRLSKKKKHLLQSNQYVKRKHVHAPRKENYDKKKTIIINYLLYIISCMVRCKNGFSRFRFKKPKKKTQFY